jgi:hypothetical protein
LDPGLSRGGALAPEPKRGLFSGFPRNPRRDVGVLGILLAHVERKMTTCQVKTATNVAARRAHFGAFLGEVDPGLCSLAGLDR